MALKAGGGYRGKDVEEICKLQRKKDIIGSFKRKQNLNAADGEGRW